MHRFHIVLICYCLVWILSPASSVLAQEQEQITWPYFSYPPYVVLSETGKSGVYWDIRKFLWSKLPNYGHRTIESPFNRSIKSVTEEGEFYCFTGLLKREDREEHLIYSLPIAIGGPHVVVCRPGSLDAWKHDGTVSLRKLMQDPRLKAGYIDGLSHGQTIDALLEPYKGTEKLFTIKSMQPFVRQFRLLSGERTDFFITNPFPATYEKRNSGSDDFEFIPIAEAKESFLSYVACTRGESGQKVIDEINAILATNTPTDAYLDMFLPWLDESLWPTFKSDFHRLVVKPSLEYHTQ
ncbi:MAG: hypothetical protein KKC99_01120 [Proteobacteria bacterium]|nr:hypothetical protein [Pseudomonadota bacterium]